MRKTTIAVSFIAIVAAAYGLYQVKWQVHDLRDQNLLVEAEIDRTKRAIEVLNAEWAYQTRPDRLKRLVELHLPELKASNGVQMADLDSFPPQIPNEEGEKQEDSNQLAKNPTLDDGVKYSTFQP